MKIWGITVQVHDAAISVIEDGEILFASSAERYSKNKNDPNLNFYLIKDALLYGKPDLVAYYENPWLKKTRQLLTGSFSYALDFSRMPKNYLKKFDITCPIHCISHHKSHAAAGFYTSPYKESAIVVIDSLGEWNTISIWKANLQNFSLLDKVSFPSSLGLLYSAFTKRCGLKPNEEEYILMGMAAYGKPIYVDCILNDFINPDYLFCLKKKCHMGIGKYLPNAKIEDLTCSIQTATEILIRKIISHAKKITNLNNLVYMGGVALNCVANNILFDYFKNVWIMPSPGDAGSSIGCAAVVYGKTLNWRGPYLGHNIPGCYDVAKVCESLSLGKVVGIARGRAEFGPRASRQQIPIGRPSPFFIKDFLNEIKKRQKYRPFAPSIPIELAHEYFDMPIKDCPYMQFTAKCKHPKDFPGAIHIDGTSRIQTVREEDNPNFHALLMSYYNKTGCPMLINTSLNIRGKPIVNDLVDAMNFQKIYNVQVF